jgi:hypothetical protein
MATLMQVFDSDYSGSIEFNEYAALHKFIHTMQFAFTQADAVSTNTFLK